MPADIARTTSFTPLSTLEPTHKSTNLYLRLCCDRNRQTFVSRQYAAYPFRLSNVFRLDLKDPTWAYLYIMNTSPGLLAGDKLRVFVELEVNANLYLTDQSATKVHSMPTPDAIAQVFYTIKVKAGAKLEFIPEPLILYANSRLEQTTQVTLHPTGQLFLSELILPGRLARNEFYEFHSYFNHLEVMSPEGDLIFCDAMRLEGKLNQFKNHFLFATMPVMLNIITVIPSINLKELIADLDSFVLLYALKLTAGNSILPNCNGLLIRAVSDSVTSLKAYTQHALNCVRRISCQTSLPEIPK